MRVNELSKQIGKSNKEVLEILQKNHFDVKSHSSKVTEEQAEAVRCFLAGAKRQTTASKTDTGKAETNRVEDIKKEPLEAEKREAEKTTEPPKKRIAAVYRPQNSVQRGSRPAGKARYRKRSQDRQRRQAVPAAASAEQTAEPAKAQLQRRTVMDREAAIRETATDREAAAIRETAMDREAAAIRETVTAREAAYQGNRDGQRSGGYQGNRARTESGASGKP